MATDDRQRFRRHRHRRRTTAPSRSPLPPSSFFPDAFAASILKRHPRTLSFHPSSATATATAGLLLLRFASSSSSAAAASAVAPAFLAGPPRLPPSFAGRRFAPPCPAVPPPPAVFFFDPTTTPPPPPPIVPSSSSAPLLLFRTRRQRYDASGMTTLRRSTRVAASSSSSEGANADRDAEEGNEPSSSKDATAGNEEPPSPTTPPKRTRAKSPKSKNAAESKKRKTSKGDAADDATEENGDVSPTPIPASPSRPKKKTTAARAKRASATSAEKRKKKKAGGVGAAVEPPETDGDEEPDVGSSSSSSEAGSEGDDGDDDDDGPTEKKKKATAKKKASSKKPRKKKKKAPDHQRQTERDELTKLWDGKKATEERGSYTFKIISWNVAGLRAVLKNRPSALPDLVSEHKPDLICLQETKLQEVHVDDPKLKLRGHLLEEEGYDSHYSCATAKKGYSGTAVFVKRRKMPVSTTDATPNGADSKSGGKKKKKQAKLGSFFQSASSKQEDDKDGTDGADKVDDNVDPDDSTGDVDVSNLIPQTVSFGLNKPQHDEEGRAITIDYPLFTLSNVYVPNSGQKLDRLTYRTDSWDVNLAEYMTSKANERGKPVIWCGDLNVARGPLETWNEGAKHLAKSAGTTPQERASFEAQLDDSRYIDAFGELHKNKKGWYTYWSQRAGNRAPNKGLRLDYFICSSGLFSTCGTKTGEEGDSEDYGGKVVVRDSYMLPDQEGSDHCPIVLELEIKK